MAKFSAVFGLPITQGALDFVDIDLSTDIPLFVDPYAIQIRQDDWSEACGNQIRSFFNALLDALRASDKARSSHLLGNLHEPNETHLGVSIGRPSGRGVGDYKAELFADALVRSRAFQTGLLSDISEAELFIRGVGRDTISDLTTNIIRGLLAQYTAEQCQLLGVPTRLVGGIGPLWNINTLRWEAQQVELPVHANRPILLVPKYSVRYKLSLDSQEFWNHYMIEFLKYEYQQNPASGLGRVLRSGAIKVTKKEVKERHPFIKDGLADFVRTHPNVLNTYKNIKGAKGPLNQSDLENDFDEAAFAGALRQQFLQIPAGNDNASRYHAITMGICTFLFYPHLIYPVKEHEIHEGRKRIDIKYTNAASEGFFYRMAASPQARALSIFIECKNYTKQLNNPELDQMSGRFGHQRGFFGIITCRNMDDRTRIIQRCRDTANDGRGYILVFEDNDFDQLLGFVEAGHRQHIDAFLHRRFSEITD
jgi:hypothetical protein